MSVQGLSLAIRSCAARPGFSLMVVGILALGVAGNAAVFSVVDGLFLRPLPFDEPGRLVDLDERDCHVDLPSIFVSDPDADAWRRENTTFESMAFYEENGVNLSGRAGAERVRGIQTTAGLLDVLRTPPLLGRALAPADEQPGAARVALLGFGLWQRMYGGSPSVLGETVRIDDVPHAVVGVLPRGSVFPSRADVWTPIALDPNVALSYWHLHGVGRLRPGVTLERASADLLRVHRGLVAMGRRFNESSEPVVRPLRDRHLGALRTSARALVGAVGILLLIACVNVGGLLIVRGSTRSHEIALRAALGASPLQVLRPLVLEVGVLVGAGGVLGLVLGGLALKGMLALMPPGIPDWIGIGLDHRFGLLCVAVTAATALLCAPAPALGASRLDLRAALHEGSSRASLPARSRLALNAVAVVEIALAVTLLAGAGLLLRAFGRVLDVDPGFRSDHVIGFRVALPQPRYPTPQSRVAFAHALLERVRAIPGVAFAGAASYPPLEPADMTGIEVEGRASRPDERGPAVVHIAVTPGYAETIGLRLVAGRAFREEDEAGVDPSPAIVSESLARWAWPGANPVGRRIRNVGSPGWMEVVGVARDVRQLGLEQDARMFVYEPYPRLPVPYLSIAFRGPADPRGLVAPARRAVRALDADLPLFDVMSMDERVSRSLWARRAYSWLIGTFAAVALVLAAAGLYGVLSYSVGQRTREIAIRAALGARPAQIVARVVGHGMGLVAAGCALGLGTALLAGGLLRSLLFGVSPRDPATLASALLVVVATALAANLVPARRAARVNPNSVLRSE